MRREVHLLLSGCVVVGFVAVAVIFLVLLFSSDGVSNGVIVRSLGAPLWASDEPPMHTVCSERGPIGVPAAIVNAYVAQGFERGPCGGAPKLFCPPTTTLMCGGAHAICASPWSTRAYTYAGWDTVCANL